MIQNITFRMKTILDDWIDFIKTDWQPMLMFLLFALLCIGVVFGLFALMHQDVARQEARDKASYEAWVKLTDNPKKITYEEYKLLGGMKGLK